MFITIRQYRQLSYYFIERNLSMLGGMFRFTFGACTHIRFVSLTHARTLEDKKKTCNGE